MSTYPDKTEDLPSIDDFGDRLKKARDNEQGQLDAEPNEGTMLGWGMRVASELVASLLIACAIGWGIDQFFGTKPWFLIVGVFIGFAAGLLNVMRAAKQMNSGLD